MGVFGVGLIVLFAMTAVFYVVFFSFMYYWHLKKITFVVVPIIFTFEYFAIGLLIVAIVSLILNYLPQVLLL
jgi:hypothetical protein